MGKDLEDREEEEGEDMEDMEEEEGREEETGVWRLEN